jgi:GTP cyclohydrolase IA
MAKKVTRTQALEAVSTLLNWIGEDTTHEGTKNTPSRVVDCYTNFFTGYKEDPKEVLSKTFKEVSGYYEPVILKNITLHSFCEHHLLPMDGKVHIAYIPDKRIVGISKLTQVVRIFSRRLQIQERLTAQIAETIQEILKPKGVAVFIEAQHYCMILQEENTANTTVHTSHFTGLLKTDVELKQQIIKQLML